MSRFVQDFRQAWRQVWRSPGFSLVAIVSLALGIGANTALFSVENAVLLRPLPYSDPDRLAVILHDGRNPVAAANFLDRQKQTRSFENMGVVVVLALSAVEGVGFYIPARRAAKVNPVIVLRYE